MNSRVRAVRFPCMPGKKSLRVWRRNDYRDRRFSSPFSKTKWKGTGSTFTPLNCLLRYRRYGKWSHCFPKDLPHVRLAMKWDQCSMSWESSGYAAAAWRSRSSARLSNASVVQDRALPIFVILHSQVIIFPSCVHGRMACHTGRLARLLHCSANYSWAESAFVLDSAQL